MSAAFTLAPALHALRAAPRAAAPRRASRMSLQTARKPRRAAAPSVSETRTPEPAAKPTAVSAPARGFAPPARQADSAARQTDAPLQKADARAITLGLLAAAALAADAATGMHGVRQVGAPLAHAAQAVALMPSKSFFFM